MIDILTLALTHGLIAFAAFSLLTRDDLDDENASQSAPHRPWLQNTPRAQQDGDDRPDETIERTGDA